VYSPASKFKQAAEKLKLGLFSGKGRSVLVPVDDENRLAL
jgi:hypothetical protein